MFVFVSDSEISEVLLYMSKDKLFCDVIEQGFIYTGNQKCKFLFTKEARPLDPYNMLRKKLPFT